MNSRAVTLLIVALLIVARFSATAAAGQTTAAPAAAEARKGFEFGYVKSDYDWAGESIWLAKTGERDRVSKKSIASLRADGTGAVNIDGNDIQLKKIKYYLPRRKFKVGRGGYQIWKGDGITLRIDYVITRLCPPADDECLVYYYKGTMDVTYRGRRKKVKITGFGGS